MSQYKVLSRAQLSYDYLHTNSTTHEFLFGALAELLDNARDASATKINIYSVIDDGVRGGNMLCFLDDGEGMSPDESADIITFGKSCKKSNDTHMIGMYGNGLKSGSMRIGNDFILFTKKGPSMSCIFLSRTFHEEENIDEIVVPMPSFDSQTKKPLSKTVKEREKQQLEMSLILKYSPFKTEAQFMKEFDKIEGNNGTLVIVYNLKLLDNGQPELDLANSTTDILLTNPDSGDFDSDEGLMPERKSFRAYASILYVDPRMRIYIQGKKVRTKRLANVLFKPRIYKYSSGRFKTRSENETRKATEEAKIADNRAKEAESKSRNLETKYGLNGTKEQKAELRRSQTFAIEMRKDHQLKKAMADRKMKALKEPKSLNFIFGININNRNQDGMFVYNCSRLIKMYQKVGPQADGGVFCSGVVGVVDVPYLVLEPTHNKQDFADAKEYRLLQRAMGEHMVQYWKDIGIAQQGVTKFWENFGYISPNWRDSPSQDPKYIRKRAMQVQNSLQCDLCLKWRILPFSANNTSKTFPDDWVCSMNPEPGHNRCSAPEQKLNIPEGVLRKENKSKEQKEKDLAEEIKKKTEILEKMQKTKEVLSSQELREAEAKKDASKRVGRVQVSTDSSDVDEDADDHGDEDDDESDEAAKRKVTKPPVASKQPDAKLKSISRAPPPRAPPSRAPPARVPSRSQTAHRSHRSAMSVAQAATAAAKERMVANSSQSRLKRRTVDLVEEEEEDISEDMSDDEPVKNNRSRPTKVKVEPVSAKKAKMEVRRQHRMEEDEEELGDLLVEDVTKKEMNETHMDTTEPDDGSPTQHVDSDVGVKVEVKVQTKWVRGTVVEVDAQQQKWKVKFDKQPQNKFDKWVSKNSSDVQRVATARQSAAESTTAGSGADGGGAETPSSTVASAPSAQSVEDIANGYRTCLRYFLPPAWVMDKEAVSTLTVPELATFPLDDFFDHYEKGLRKLVSSFQYEAQSRQQEAEQAKAKLGAVRRMIAKLLKSTNEEIDIDPECDTEQVDDLLALCVKQTTQAAP